MSIASFFGFSSSSVVDNELPDIYRLGLPLGMFVDTDVVSTYQKILTDCIERTQGIPADLMPVLWDNCLQSENSSGLMTLVAKAMTGKQDLFVVYRRDLGVVRLASQGEVTQIKEDYKAKGFSDVGVYISFRDYKRTDMVKIYSEMEYNVLCGLNKVTNLSKTIQFKMDSMRSSVSLSDSAITIAQAMTLASNLRNGKDVLLDGKDMIEVLTPDISTIKEAILFLNSKKCFYYAMPLSYINGEQTGGIGATGEADTKAVERGLKQYYISIVKPILESVLDIQTSFKSNDFRQIQSGLEVLKTFELVSNDYLSSENKKIITSRMFDVSESE